MTHCPKFSPLLCLPTETMGVHDSVSQWGHNVIDTESWYLTNQWTRDDNVNKGGPSNHGGKYNDLHHIFKCNEALNHSQRQFKVQKKPTDCYTASMKQYTRTVGRKISPLGRNLEQTPNFCLRTFRISCMTFLFFSSFLKGWLLAEIGTCFGIIVRV